MAPVSEEPVVAATPEPETETTAETAVETEAAAATEPEATAEPEIEIDLDQFLNTEPADSPTPRIRVALPNADRMAVVGILGDDSGSMDHLRNPVIDGLKLSIEAFKGAKGSDFHLSIKGFKEVYFQGMLRDVQDDQFDEYYPDYRQTPLVRDSISQLRNLRSQASQYRNLGIPTTVALLIITDGMPYCDEKDPEDFQELLDPNDFIVGMGIAPRGDDSSYAREYRDLFAKMGITKVVTPHSAPAEVRHSINQFSQSVASIAAA